MVSVSSEETQAGDLTDELAKKYDPERLLRLIAKRAGKGEALDLHLRQKYERRLGVDLSHVRIYTGEFAEEFNRQRSAYAVTIGSTGAILMGGSAEKSLASATGEALLGHELTHVAQQVRHGGGGLRRKTSFDGGMPFAEEHELEAEAMERAILQEAAGGPPIVADDPNQAAAMQKARANAAAQLKDQIEKVKQRVIELMGEMTRSQTIRTGTVRRA